MNKEELEKLIDNEDFMETYWLYEDREEYFSKDKLKQFIFETIIPEVLKSVILEKREENNHIDLAYNNYWKYIKNKAKELYNINL